jgi:hypothetical protein
MKLRALPLPLQPARHPHLAVHRRRGGEVLLRLLALARASVELAKAEVAVGGEQAHPEPPSTPSAWRKHSSASAVDPSCMWASPITRRACACSPRSARSLAERSFRPPPRRPVVSPVRAAPSPLRGRRPRRRARRSPTPAPGAPAPGHRRRDGRAPDASGPTPPASAPRPARTCRGG